MNLFDEKAIKPMLIKEMQEPFNDPNYIYELKMDGIRCISYLDSNGTDLRNKRNISLIPKFPELKNMSSQVKERCILDGELVVLKNNMPEFYEVQRRTIMTDSFKIQLAYNRLPASFVAYDILYYKDKDVTKLTLMERKRILSDIVKENNIITVSRYIEEYGIELFDMADIQKIEGVVAKRKDSKYYFDKRTKDWIKFKRMADEDFIICGIIRKLPMSTLILGQYDEDKLVYKGSVSFGVRANMLKEYNYKTMPTSPFESKVKDKIDEENGITWMEPKLVCTVEYMPNSKDSLRQPVFKGFREDVLPEECQVRG